MHLSWLTLKLILAAIGAADRSNIKLKDLDIGKNFIYVKKCLVVDFPHIYIDIECLNGTNLPRGYQLKTCRGLEP